MTPEYVNELANLADPDEMWRLPAAEQHGLSPEKRRQLDAGVALRRHAAHLERLRNLLGSGRSLLITPLTPNSVASKHVLTPEVHRRLMK